MYQGCTKRNPDGFFSLKNIRIWQTSFATMQSMAVEITNRTKQQKLKESEKQMPVCT